MTDGKDRKEAGGGLSEAGGKLLYYLLAPSCKQIGAALGDYVGSKIGQWRINNLEKIAAKAYPLVDGKRRRPLPLKTALTFVEAASMDEDEKMQTLWANLLCQYLVAGAERRESFVGILSRLTPIEARVFDMLYQSPDNQADFYLPRKLLHKSNVMEKFGLSKDDYAVAYGNLLSAAIIDRPSAAHHAVYKYLTTGNGVIFISEFGLAFGDYVIAPGLPPPGGLG